MKAVSLWTFDAMRALLPTTSGMIMHIVQVLNDFVAVGYAIPTLGESDLVMINQGERVEGGPVAVMGPGTGLGECQLMWDSGVLPNVFFTNTEQKHMHPAPCCGGHDVSRLAHAHVPSWQFEIALLLSSYCLLREG